MQQSETTIETSTVTRTAFPDLRDKPTIAFIGNFLSTSRGGRSVCEDLSDKLEEIGYPVVRSSSKLNRIARLVDMIWTTSTAHYSAAIVDVYSGRSFFWAEIASAILRWRKKPFALTLHGGALAEFAAKWPGRVRRLLHCATTVTSPSFFLKEMLQGFREDIFQLPNAIELNKYTFRERTIAEPKLCWLRAMHRIYDPFLTIETVRLLVEEFPSLHLSMYGPDLHDGSSMRVLESIHRYNLKENITWYGTLPNNDVPAVLNKSDIFLNTTTFESFGIAMMEAAASGLCIATTNVGELPHLWTDGENSLLVPPRDPMKMAEAVRRILCNPPLARQLSLGARRRAQNFDWSTILPQWEKICLDLSLGGNACRLARP